MKLYISLPPTYLYRLQCINYPNAGIEMSMASRDGTYDATCGSKTNSQYSLINSMWSV